MKKIFIVLFLSIFFVSACKEDNKKNNNLDTTKQLIPDIVKVKDKLFNVPSPIQASFLVKDQKIPFNQDYLNKPSNYSKYLTSFKQSLNIGVYGANLGNLFIYDQLSQAAQYMSVVKKLSEQVGILNSLNKTLFERIEKNTENRDSLIFLISDIYKEIDSYLSENDQQDIGILIITGGWIESVYLLTQIAKINNNPEVIARIGEQKTPLNNIILLLEPYFNTKSSEFDTLFEDLTNLAIYFDAIEENYTYKQPETKPDEKLTIIHSTTTYNISDEDLAEITKKVEEIRTWVIK